MPSMSRFITVFLLFLLFSLDMSAQNQLYFTQHRPAGLDWKELNSPHFRIIFADGHEDIARRSARILESQYQLSYDLTGGSLSRFPVVLSPYNDVTNGFVSSVNFRSEIDLSPFKGKSLNPQSGSWLETVLPHELIHANHANVTNPYSFATVLGLLGPDYRRSFNLFPPLGVHEGLAVYHESEHGIREHSGRSNYTFFQNQFNANLAGSNSWNMGQTLISSEYTLPGGRHYIAGATFTKWLHETYGDDISKRAIQVHQNLFFLGYGFALKYVTGKWPGELYDEYQNSQYAKEETRVDFIDETTDQNQLLIESPFSGVRQQRPIWISDSEILYFSRQYNAPGAFYIYDQVNDSHRKLSEHFLIGDFYMDFEQETDHLFIGESFALNRIFSNYQADIVRLNVQTGSEFRITDGERLYAPDKSGSNIYALQPNGDISNVVKYAGNSVDVLTNLKDRSVVAVKASPHNEGELAVLINQRGVQALWIVNEESITDELNEQPTIAFKEGSIHDPVWHPTENKLMFTMDAFPAMNIYEFDLETEKIIQLTNSTFNAMEASYHPNDGSIVYVTQNDNERNIAVLSSNDLYNQEVEPSVLLTGAALEDAITAPFIGDELLTESANWTISDYGKDYRWLKPRAILPVLKEKSGKTEWGAAVLSTDVLQSQLYSIELSTIQDRLWYNASYSNKTFYPGFGVNVYSVPEFVRIRFSETEAPVFLQEENGFSVNSTFEYYFDKIDRFSSVFFRPSLNWEQLRFNDLTPTPASDFSTQWKATLFAQMNIRLMQKPRDIQPSSGFQLYGQIEDVLNDSELNLTYNGDQYLLGLPKRYAYFYGANWYLAPFPKTNQSLLLSARFLNQSDRKLFSNDSIIPIGFEDGLFATSSSIGRFSSRYTIPIAYPDKGGLLVPFYVSNIYMTLFSHTLVNYDNIDPSGSSRGLIGTSIQFRFKLSNLALDFGLGLTYDLARNTTDFYVGSF
jgi:Tol biopolymer transport system component